MMEMGGGTSASLSWSWGWLGSLSEEDRVGESVTMTGGSFMALDGVSLGEADRELTESPDGDDDLEKLFSARASWSSSLSSSSTCSMSSCLTDSVASTSMAMVSLSAGMGESAFVEPCVQESGSKETWNPSALAASRDLTRVELRSERNLICATAPRRTLTR